MEQTQEQKQKGRPKKANANTSNVSVKFSVEFLARLDSYCERSGKHRGQVIREAVEIYLKKHDKPHNNNTG